MGRYPVQTVKTMAKIARTTEKTINFHKLLHERIHITAASVTEALGEASAEIAQDLNVPAIITCTATGTTARLASKYRPEAKIVAAASRESTARQLALSWGVIPLSVPMAENTDDLMDIAIHATKDAKLIKPGDTVVVIAGVPVGMPGDTSLVRVMTVP
jgi:pyruvate kinase